jgi:hypothetical protein
MNFAVLDA